MYSFIDRHLEGIGLFIIIMSVVALLGYTGDKHTDLREKRIEAINKNNLECVIREKARD